VPNHHDVSSPTLTCTDEHDLPLELKYEVNRGFFLRVPTSEIQDRSLPTIFINVVERKKMSEFTTLELVKRNSKIGDSLTEVFLMSASSFLSYRSLLIRAALGDKTVQKLTEDIRKEISALYKVCEALAMLDMVRFKLSISPLTSYWTSIAHLTVRLHHLHICVPYKTTFGQSLQAHWPLRTEDILFESACKIYLSSLTMSMPTYNPASRW
jgi:hypothetical protein